MSKLVRSYKRHEENKRKIGQEAAGRLPKSSAHSMNARKCAHALTKALPLSGSRAERGKREEKTGKTEARRLMERKAAQSSKNTSDEWKQGLPKHS